MIIVNPGYPNEEKICNPKSLLINLMIFKFFVTWHSESTQVSKKIMNTLNYPTDLK